MKTFQQLIIELSKEPIAKLYSTLNIAIEKPETGIKIVNPSAKFVIRDSAKVAKDFLPIFLFGKMSNPIDTLKSKVTKEMLVQLNKDSEIDIASKQLMTLIIEESGIKTVEKVETPVVETVEDVYGSYSSTIEVVESVESLSKLDLLCKIFNK